MPINDPIAQAVASRANFVPEPERAEALEPLISRLAKARVVVLGEASHGTREFYAWRAAITRELVSRHRFDLIGVEGDWVACRKVHRYLNGEGPAADAEDVLRGAFLNWPTWMWANREMVPLIEDLRGSGAGFHGLDLYGLFDALDGIEDWLRESVEPVNPFFARKVRSIYQCFAPFGRDEDEYARSLFQDPKGCEDAVIAGLNELLQIEPAGSGEDREALFFAQQCARVVRSGERHLRMRSTAPERAWNVRDAHMAETLELLLKRGHKESRAVIWCHNNHVGDYRGTDLSPRDYVTLGGLAKDQYGEGDVCLVGFGTYEGKALAARSWGGAPRETELAPAREGSWEHYFHGACRDSGIGRCFVTFAPGDAESPFGESRDFRSIGVAYDPSDPQELDSVYLPVKLARRYDAFVFEDRTSALIPLSRMEIGRALRA